MKKYLILFFLFFTVLEAAKCENMLFSFDIHKQSSNIKIVDILENMAQKCEFSVKMKDKVTAQILEKELFLVHIQDYSLDDMFDFLFTQNNMFYKFDAQKNVLNISYVETNSFVIDYINLSKHITSSSKNILVGSSGSESGTQGSNTSNENNSDKTIVNSETEFNFWNNIKSEIKEILSLEGAIEDQSTITVNIETGIVTVTGNAKQMNLVETYLKKLMNRLHKQVMLEVKLFEVQYDDSQNIGIDWSVFTESAITLGGSVGYDSTAATSQYATAASANFNVNFKMGDLISFLDTYGDVNVISTPKIMTLNNQPAVINVGSQYNYQYISSRTIDAEGRENYGTANGSSFIGLTLNILPEITEDGYVVLRMNPVVSDIIEKFTDRAPDIKIKQLSSIIKAKNGARVISGGLVSYSTTNNTSKVKGLGDLPLFEYAFKNEKGQVIKKELIIVVTPTIIDYDNYPSIDNIESLLDGFKNE